MHGGFRNQNPSLQGVVLKLEFYHLPNNIYLTRENYKLTLDSLEATNLKGQLGVSNGRWEIGEEADRTIFSRERQGRRAAGVGGGV